MSGIEGTVGGDHTAQLTSSKGSRGRSGSSGENADLISLGGTEEAAGSRPRLLRPGQERQRSVCEDAAGHSAGSRVHGLGAWISALESGLEFPL